MSVEGTFTYLFLIPMNLIYSIEYYARITSARLIERLAALLLTLLA